MRGAMTPNPTNGDGKAPIFEEPAASDAGLLSRIQSRQGLYGGGLIVLIGIFALSHGLSYHVGSLTEMGPGFFPAALGAILVVTGITIAMIERPSAVESTKTSEIAHAPDWRGCICISLAIVAFVLLGRHGGLLPATFAIVFISALGDRANTIVSAFLLASFMTCVCVVIFWWALQLQLPLFQWG